MAAFEQERDREDGHRDRAQRGEHEGHREQPERQRAQRRRRAGGRRLRGGARFGAGAGRRTRACSGTVTAASTTARIEQRVAPAVASISAWQSGRKMKLASAATSVMAVIARRRSAGGEVLGHDGERGLVQHGRHHQPDRRPHGVERDESVDLRPARRRARRRRSSRRVISARGLWRSRWRPTAMPATRGDGEGERERAGELGGRVPEVALHRDQERGEGVVEDPPGDGLGDRQRADDAPGPRAPRGRRGRLSTAAVALTAPRRRRGALLRARAAARRRRRGSLVQARRCALQTPVSGRTSSTRRAASQSPASAATTERTCS